jgi:hypothetical protein
MLARRKPPRMRQDAPQTVYKRHQAFVRRHVCIVPGCPGKPQFCHVRSGLPASTPSWARAGKDMRPHDAFGFPACAEHHLFDQHRIGEPAFERKHGVSLLKEALDLARNSPCPEVREFARSLKP